MNKLIKLLKMRSYVFLCSYKTTWEQWLTNEEKQGFTYDEVINKMR